MLSGRAITRIAASRLAPNAPRFAPSIGGIAGASISCGKSGKGPDARKLHSQLTYSKLEVGRFLDE